MMMVMTMAVAIDKSIQAIQLCVVARSAFCIKIFEGSSPNVYGE